MFRIGPYSIATPVALAPMAGITDKPFRRLARRFGAGYAVSEMMASDPSLRHTKKSLSRGDFDGEDGLRAVQIAGSDPKQMAEAARYNVENGAQIIRAHDVKEHKQMFLMQEALDSINIW